MTSKFIEPDCSNCPVKCQKVAARGPIDADVVIICDSPSLSDKKKDMPLAGTSGNVVLPEVPKELRDKVYITFAVPCPSSLYKDPNVKIAAAKACHHRLISEIKAYPRKMIITLGNAASGSVTSDYNFKITQDRGQLITSEYASIAVMPIMSPQALLKGIGSYKQFKSDMAYAFELAAGGEIRKSIVPDITIVDEHNVHQVIKHIAEYEYAGGDIETGGLNSRQDEILCLGVSVRAEECFIFTEDFLRSTSNHRLIQTMLDSVKWIWQNGKFDVSFIRFWNYEVQVDEDTMLLSYALDENPGGHDLEQISKNLIGAPDYKYMVKPYLPNKNTSYREIPKDVLYPYCGYDVSNMLQDWYILRKMVNADPASKKLYEKVLIPGSEFLGRVEDRGVTIDIEYLNKLKDPHDPNSVYCQVEQIKSEFQSIVGYAINPNSPKQVAKHLFDELNLPKKKGRSTAEKVLELMPDLPVIRALKKYRTQSKLYSTYVKKVHEKIDPTTGRIHTTYKLHGSRTGRLSSSAPNIQNIPRGPQIRGMYVPREGYEFIEVDLNQAELRCLAQLSGCAELCAIYNDPTHAGLHHETSVALFREDYTSEQKMRAKAVNFGIVYGREAASLAEEFNQPMSEAQRWIDAWFERFPGAAEFIKKCRMAAANGQTLTTCFGNKKRPQIVTPFTVKGIMNQAANFPHQSIASNITLTAGINTAPIINAIDAWCVNLVHDSNIIESPITVDHSIRDQVIKIVATEMEAIPARMGLNRVPFLADAKVSQTRWGDLEDYVPATI